MGWIKTLLLSATMCVCMPAFADNIVILGLFKNKVVLKKDGKRMVLKAGETTPDGLEVVSVNSKQAVIVMDGKREAYELGMQISASFAPPKLARIQIEKDNHGMYRIAGKINQSNVNFLVDTGATMLALNANQARALNIPYTEGLLTVVETASGQANAYRIKLRHVSVGQILVRDVDALVVDGDSPKDVLLGMSFLKHLKMENSASIMVLEQKF